MVCTFIVFTDAASVPSYVGQVFQFSQADVDQGKILFRHQGSAYGRTALWITDGQFHTTGILEVQASDAFLERVNRTKLIVRRGHSASLSVAHLGIISNMDYSPHELTYRLTQVPLLGNIYLNGVECDSFDESQLAAGSVSYSHQSNQSLFKDQLKFTASLRNIQLEDMVEIQIFADSYWQPLSIINYQPVTVEESTSVTIDQSSLKISQLYINPKDVVYIVHQPPLHGYLEVDYEQEYEDSADAKNLPPEVNIFDQSVINDNRLHYIQSAPNQTSDYFVFDVTNGVVMLSNLTFDISIIPKSIYLLTKSIEVLEGGHVPLTASDIKIMTQYYVDKVDSFIVSRPPFHGTIQLKGAADQAHQLTKFTYHQLIAMQITYWHDGSEDSSDTIEIIAVAGNISLFHLHLT